MGSQAQFNVMQAEQGDFASLCVLVLLWFHLQSCVVFVQPLCVVCVCVCGPVVGGL